MTDAYRNHDAALAERRADLERQLAVTRRVMRVVREQAVDIDRQLDANRSLEDAPARQREDLKRRLEVTREDERLIQLQLDEIDRERGGYRGPSRGRKIAWAALFGVGAALTCWLAYDHGDRELRELERRQAFSFVSAMARGVVAHHMRTGELCPAPPAGVPLSDSKALATLECMRLNVPLPRHHTFYYNTDGNYLGAARRGQDHDEAVLFEAAAVRDLDGDGETSLIAQTGALTSSRRFVSTGEFFVVGEAE